MRAGPAAGWAAAGARGHTPLASLGAIVGVVAESLKPCNGVMRAFFEALILIAAPVAAKTAAAPARKAAPAKKAPVKKATAAKKTTAKR